MKYKLIVSDYDGTTAIGKVINPEVVNSIKKYRENGGKFVFCTGRHNLSIAEIMENNGVEVDGVISFQGSYAVAGDKVLIDGGIPKQTVIEIIKTANEIGRSVSVMHRSKIYAANEETSQVYCSYFASLVPVETYYDVSAFDNCDIEYFNKVSMYRVPAEEFYSAMAHINEKFGDRVIANTSSTGFIEIISNKHTKYLGAKTIAEHFGFNENEVVTIGDSNNDMTLLRYGYGIAVANAENDLKSIAKHVAPSVQENALCYVIEKALLGEEF